MTGLFKGDPPTDRAIDIVGITVMRFGQSRCVERWSVVDFLMLMLMLMLMLI